MQFYVNSSIYTQWNKMECLMWCLTAFIFTKEQNKWNEGQFQLFLKTTKIEMRENGDLIFLVCFTSYLSCQGLFFSFTLLFNFGSILYLEQPVVSAEQMWAAVMSCTRSSRFYSLSPRHPRFLCNKEQWFILFGKENRVKTFRRMSIGNACPVLSISLSC